MAEINRSSPPLFTDNDLKDDQDDGDLFTSALEQPSTNSKEEPVNHTDKKEDDDDDLFSGAAEIPVNPTDKEDHETAPLRDPVGRLSDIDLRASSSAGGATDSDEAAAKTPFIASRSDEADDEDDKDDPSQTIEILVSDPKKSGEGMGAYVVYRVTTRTNIKHFKRCEMSVSRRFSDFLGLHEKLVNKYQSCGFIVPPPPEKSVIGMAKVKVVKEDTGSMDFVEKRRAALERFLNRVAKHPELCKDSDFVDFVEMDGELPKASGTAALSGAGFVRLLNKVGDSIGKFTYTMTETDEWFEDKSEQLELMDRDLQQLHGAIELLVMHRKDLSQSTQQFSKSVAVLGSTEEHMSLSRALSQLSEVETKIYQLHADQADTDFFVVSELIKDYVCVIQTIKDVFHERVKHHKVWKDAESALAKKQEERTKLESQRKLDKVVGVNQEITELEQKVAKGEEDFNEISKTIKKKKVPTANLR